MANKIVLKKSSVTGRVPSTSDLDYGELALNYSDGKLYFKNSSNVINAFKVNNDLSTVLDRKLYTVSSAGTNTFAVDYEVGFVDVYVNGVKLNSSEFTATDGLNVTITALVVGDEVQLTGFRSFTYGDISTRYIRQTYTATAGQTTFNIEYSLSNGGATAYVQVFVNGVLLDTSEYTASSGTAIVLATAASAGDIVECIGLNDFQIFDLLTSGTGLSYNNNTGTITLNSATAATANTVALRDGSGNLTANTFTGALSGNATTATTLQTARTINGVSFNGSANISFGTDSVSEGSTNLYYTSTRANADFDTRLATKSTSNLAEGTNLYYTNARVQTQIAAVTPAGGFVGVTQLNSAISTEFANRNAAISEAVAGLVDSSPTTLDTLNELAAALGDDPNFATTVANSIGTKVSKSGDTMTGTLNIQGSSATNVLKLYVSGSTQWSLGVGDTSGTNFNISADFGSLLINKSSGNVTTPGQFYAGTTNLVLHAGNYSSYALPLSGGTVTGTTVLANAFRFYTGGSDGSTSYGDFRTNPATGNSIISAKTNALYFNYDHGTGGVVFCNGAAGTVGTVDASGNANFIGAITQNSSQVLHAGNYNSYALPLTGGTLTGTSTVSVASWSKWVLETTGVTAKARQGSDGNGLNFTTNALWNGAWTEDDNTKKKFAYIQHLGNGRHEFRTAAAGAGVSWVTSLVVDENGATVTGGISTTGTISSTGGRLVLRDDSIENHLTDTDTASVTINYFGYGSGNSRFRDLNVYNGKAALKFSITGSTGKVYVNDYIQFQQTTGAKLRFYDAATDKYGVDVQSSELRIFSGAQGDATGGITLGKYDGTTFTENMRIRNDGNITSRGTLSLGSYFVAGSGVAGGYYQDASNGAYRALANDGTNRGYYFQNSSGNSTMMYVGLVGTYAGKIGLATTSPSAKLSVNSGNSTYVTVPGNLGDWDGTMSIFGNANDSRGAALGIGMTDIGGFISSLSPSNAWKDMYYNAGNQYWYNGASSRMGLTDTGLGVGTTSPAYKLSVIQAADVWHAQFGTSGGKQIRIGGSTTNGGVIGAYNTDNNSSPASLILQRDGGYVAVGNDNPLTRLHVTASTPSGAMAPPAGTTITVDSSTNNYMLFRNTGDNGTYSGIAMADNNVGGYVLFGNAGGAGDKMYIGGYGGVDIQHGTSSTINPTARTTVGTFNSSGLTVYGNLYATGNIYSSYSDINLKNITGKIENALDKVCAMEGFLYRPNQLALDIGAEDQVEVGISAQAALENMPEIVATRSDGYLTARYERAVPYLIEAIKEQQAQIEELKAIVAQLLNRG